MPLPLWGSWLKHFKGLCFSYDLPQMVERSGSLSTDPLCWSSRVPAEASWTEGQARDLWGTGGAVAHDAAAAQSPWNPVERGAVVNRRSG